MKHLGIDKEHKSKIDEITKYMEEHRVQELFNVRQYHSPNFFLQEILTNILNNRPPNAKLYIIQCLKNIQRQPHNDDPQSRSLYQFPEGPFLTTEDFEALFDAYDVLGIQTVPIAYLAQALSSVGVENAETIIKDHYPELVQESYINKVTFVYVLEEEHRRLGFSYSRPY